MWNKIISLSVLILTCANLLEMTFGAEDNGCFEKWLQGYRLALGRPQQMFSAGSLEKCQAICEREHGCGALAFGISGSGNGTCELAIRSLRDSRSVNSTSIALNYDEIQKASHYDIYVMSSTCIPRQPLYSSYSPQATGGGGNGNGVPIDCFYRLMSGKRVVKNHIFKSISVKELQECQEACIEDVSCRSINYRYMMTGYTYNVANCEMSLYYILNYEDSNRRAAHEFIDDYDYDYFQREPHCKTTSPLGYSGVCAMVVNRGSKLSPALIKSQHQTSTTAQCEFLCQTASRFRCRAFSVRHTTRGRDPFHRDAASESTCTLYDADISRLPNYEIVPDPDYDLFEIGRLMGTECVLQDQYLNRRPGQDSFKHTHYEPASPRPGYDRERDRDRDRPSYDRPNAPLPYPPNRPYELTHKHDRNEYNSRRPITFYPPEDRQTTAQAGDSSFPKPGLANDHFPHIHVDQHYYNRPSADGHATSTATATASSSSDLPYYDSRREACLVKFQQDVYLSPEVTRAQFPAKNLEECRVECIRALEVLRFPCRMLSYRLTSNSGGSCQLSEYNKQEARSNDFVPARDRYENAVVYHFDEADVLCRRPGGNRYDYDDRYTVNSRYPPVDNRYPDTDRRHGSGGGGGYGSYGGSTGGRYPYGTDTRYPYGTEGRYSSGSGSGSGSGYGATGWQGVNSGGSYTPGSSYVLPSRDTSLSNYQQRPLYDRDSNRYPYGQGSYGSGGVAGGYYPEANRDYLPRPDGYGREQTQTVNGEKCLRSCVQDKEAGFHYCLLDTRGTWDFCCRPDHFCGYSRGVSVPWCYVGSGPTSQIWRSCHKRSIGSLLEPPIAYLHEGPPPKIHSLSTAAAAALSKDSALKLLKSDLKEKHNAGGAVTSSDFADIDGETETLSNSVKEELHKAGSNLNTTEIYFGKLPSNELGNISNTTKRQIRRISKKPSFTVVEVHSTSSKE